MYPEVAVNLDLDDNGICSSCYTFVEGGFSNENELKRRETQFLELVEKMRKITPGDYDCIVPVGGGKDSYWQAHLVKQYGLKPLLITYHGNNYLPEGQKNLDHMRKALNCDHYIFRPSTETLIKLNRVCFKKMGDMNWHAHAGIKIVPMLMAIKFQVPLVVWGEIAWDISGMFSPDDYAEYNKRTVLEHDMRGYTLNDMVGEEQLKEEDMNWIKMPSDEEFAQNNIRGIFLGNYFKWDPIKQTQIIKKKYNWESARQPFERTYRTISNLDDMHENGIHDYMKWIKFGYGRCSDHASKDIRTGYMTREEGIEMVRKYDHVKPMRDLERWLNYVNMTEEEFDRIADTFRDSRVWSKDKNGHWEKDNIWDFEEREK
jgi:N-acetyl sugar amidotransferase